MKDDLLAIERDLETLSRAKGVTIPEVVESIKKGVLSRSADPDVAKDYFAKLDEIARLHTN